MFARCLFALLCLALSPFAASADDGPAPGIAELEVLARYVGEFDLRISESVLNVNSGEGRGQWILGGRFVEQTGTMTSADGSQSVSLKTIYTYDAQARVYRSWTFGSTGLALERSGTFDTATHTLTLDGTLPNGVASRQTSDFSDPEQVSWSVVSFAADGTETVINRGISTPKDR